MIGQNHIVATRKWSHKINKSGNNRCWQGCGERGTLLHCCWECKLAQTLWKKVWRFLKKLKIELPYDPAIALLYIYPKDTNMVLWRGMCTRMFIAAMSTIAKLWEEPSCPSTDEWIKKRWYVYTTESYATIKRNEILPFAKKWMERKGIMLSEISQSEKDSYHMISLIWAGRDATWEVWEVGKE